MSPLCSFMVPLASLLLAGAVLLESGDRSSFLQAGSAAAQADVQVQKLPVQKLPIQKPPAQKTLAQSRTATQQAWSGDFALGWQQQWQVQPKGQWGSENFEVRQASGPYRDILRVSYPAGSASPSLTRDGIAPLGGGQFYAQLGLAAQNSLRLSYAVRFPQNFEFVRGGKLPGLYGGAGNSGGNRPNGQDGFSARLMWREKGAGEVYAYLPNGDRYGTSLGRGNWHFKRGQWQRIEQEIVLNTPNQADGQIRMWIDGQLVLEEEGLVFRTTPNLKIDGLFFSTFFGGGDPSWATPQDTHIDFADFRVSFSQGYTQRPSP